MNPNISGNTWAWIGAGAVFVIIASSMSRTGAIALSILLILGALWINSKSATPILTQNAVGVSNE